MFHIYLVQVKKMVFFAKKENFMYLEFDLRWQNKKILLKKLALLLKNVHLF